MANRLIDAAAEIQAYCIEVALPFCFIGGLAVLRWGDPRLTRDVDLTALAEYGHESAIARGLLDAFDSRVDDALEFALANRVLLLRSANGTAIDLALGALAFEKRAVERSSEFTLFATPLRTCSAEDLIVHKVFAGRDHDWTDVSGIIARRHDLDAALIEDELTPLLAAKDASQDLDRFRALLV